MLAGSIRMDHKMKSWADCVDSDSEDEEVILTLNETRKSSITKTITSQTYSKIQSQKTTVQVTEHASKFSVLATEDSIDVILDQIPSGEILDVVQIATENIKQELSTQVDEDEQWTTVTKGPTKRKNSKDGPLTARKTNLDNGKWSQQRSNNNGRQQNSLKVSEISVVKATEVVEESLLVSHEEKVITSIPDNQSVLVTSELVENLAEIAGALNMQNIIPDEIPVDVIVFGTETCEPEIVEAIIDAMTKEETEPSVESMNPVPSTDRIRTVTFPPNLHPLLDDTNILFGHSAERIPQHDDGWKIFDDEEKEKLVSQIVEKFVSFVRPPTPENVEIEEKPKDVEDELKQVEIEDKSRESVSEEQIIEENEMEDTIPQKLSDRKSGNHFTQNPINNQKPEIANANMFYNPFPYPIYPGQQGYHFQVAPQQSGYQQMHSFVNGKAPNFIRPNPYILPPGAHPGFRYPNNYESFTPVSGMPPTGHHNIPNQYHPPYFAIPLPDPSYDFRHPSFSAEKSLNCLPVRPANGYQPAPMPRQQDPAKSFASGQKKLSINAPEFHPSGAGYNKYQTAQCIGVPSIILPHANSQPMDNIAKCKMMAMEADKILHPEKATDNQPNVERKVHDNNKSRNNKPRVNVNHKVGDEIGDPEEVVRRIRANYDKLNTATTDTHRVECQT